MTADKTAILYRMVMDKHVCPYGIKAKYLLERQGYTVDDRHLKTREATDAFKAEHGVTTTPQTFIAGTRIGGFDDLLRHFGKPVKDANAVSYVPVIAVFAMAAAMALSISWMMTGNVLTMSAIEMFVAIAMCLLAVPNCRMSTLSLRCSSATTCLPGVGHPTPPFIRLRKGLPAS